jgi:hypothetical protein
MFNKHIYLILWELLIVLEGFPLCAADVSYAFEKFPAQESYIGEPHVPILEGDLKRFKTVITSQVANGPNFAGAYTIVTWGCGSDCQISLSFNAKTGQPYRLGITEFGLKFRKDSKLIILNPDITDDVYKLFGSKTRYLVWDGQAIKDIEPKDAILADK